MRTQTGFKRILAMILSITIIISTLSDIISFAADSIPSLTATEFDNSNSSRVHLNWMNASFGGVKKKNFIKVYAFEGDTICLGSDVYNAGGFNLEGNKVTSGEYFDHNDKDSIDIVMYDLDGNPTPLDVTQNGKGHISDYDTEQLAKSMTSPTGNTKNGKTYTPITYAVRETGVYTFEFRSYNGGGNTGKVNKKDGWLDPSDSTRSGLIAAWDVSVFNEDGDKEHGRTYADYMSLQMNGGNMMEKYYILTTDSYIYEMTFNGATPYTYNFFSNNRGIIDSATGNIVYKSAKDTSNSNLFAKLGISYKYPGTKDTDLSKSFYIFFEKPNEDLEGHLYEKALEPDPAKNIHFVDKIKTEDGKEVPGSYVGRGGYFAFDVEDATTATLRLEFKKKGAEGKTYAPVEISDVVKPHSTNYFYWDGKDGNGTVIPSGDYSIEDLVYTVTTKAGEIHFPIFDMEYANKGITFTRVSNIYNKAGEQLDTSGTIYDATRSVVYYDDTAIYYGENVASTGVSENQVDCAIGKFNTSDDLDPAGKYCLYNNMQQRYSGSEYTAFNSEYRKEHKLRVGDHSHTNNVIDFTAKTITADQQAMIDYLDSSKNPVAVSTSSSTSGTNNNGTVTDYAIANYWTFIPSEPATATSGTGDNIKIIDDGGKGLFNLTGRVFYDANSNGTYNAMDDADSVLADVDLRLYKKTEDKIDDPSKTYVDEKCNPITIASADGKDVYELIKENTTPLIGNCFFSNLEYDKENGTEFLYQVVKPNPNYTLTSSGKQGITGASTGIYALYAFDKNAYGTEIQKIKVGGEGGVDPEESKNERHTITAIDVGYHYDTTSYDLTVKKDWQIPSGTKIQQPDSVAYEISYNINEGDGKYKVGTYEMRSLSGISSWSHTYDYLETYIEEKPVVDYYVSAEYYIYKDKIFRHKFDYKADDRNGTYQDFIGDDEYFSLTDYYNEHRELENPGNESGGYNIANMPDFDGNGSSNANDFKAIKETEWKKALAAGSTPTEENNVVAPFNSVLDRNPGTATTEISITNSTQPGTIEVYKYTDGDSGERLPLDGATFRIYKGDMEIIKDLISKYNDAQAKLSADPENEVLKNEFNAAAKAVQAVNIDSGSTRVNGLVAFPGLDPTQTYTIRERYAPDGYRILEEYYQVNPKGSGSGRKFNDESYCKVQIGNAAAEGELEIRKRIEGHEWENSYSFDFDINFNYDGETLTDDITISDNANFYDVVGGNWKSVIEPFVEKFNSDKEVTINYDDEYIKLSDGSTSPDTKSSENLLKAGSESEAAALNDNPFPAAGSYTFTIKENDLPKDSTLTKSPRVYTVTINVVRVLNASAKPEAGKSDPEITKDNSHLEAEVSKINVYEVDGEGNSGETTTYAASAPVFTNTYSVENVTQHTAYSVIKNFTGRDWTADDKFTFLIESTDDVTRDALEKGNLELDAIGLESTDVTGQYKFTIDKDTADHKFTLNDIKFNDIIFPVEDSGVGGEPTTKPVIYTLKIKEQIPEGAEKNFLKGITYSDVEYTLKITLTNGKDDHIIDSIVFEMSSNKSPETVYKCEIKQEVVDEHTSGAVLEGDVWVKKTETHNASGHVMNFFNTYRATASWTPKVSKTLLGRKFSDGEQFNFTLQETDRRADKIFTGTRSVSITSNNAQAEFPQINFTKAGNYQFTITEVNPDGENITTDPNSSRYVIDVNAVDNGDGTLTLNFTSDSGYDSFDTNTVVNFVNTFKDSGEFDLSITKTLTGRAWADTDSFTFKIKPDDITKAAIKAANVPDEITPQIIVPSEWGDPDENGIYTVTVSKSDSKGVDISSGIITKTLGSIQLKNVQSDDNRTFKFTVSEVSIPSYIECTEDSIDLNITVTPKTSSETGLPTGELEVMTTYAYAAVTVSTPDSLSFTNNYSANGPFTNELSITKILNGRKDDKWLDTDSFTFNIEGNDEITKKAIENKNITMPEELVISCKTEKTLTLNDKINFSSITFPVKEGVTQDLVYKFKITEENGGIEGINYDSSEYIVTVKLSDNGDGTFNSMITDITKNGEPVSTGGKLTFTNEYIPAVLEVSKTVVNADGSVPGDSKFEFKVTLTPNDGSTLETSYPYVIHTEGSADESGELELTDSSGTAKTGTFNLKHGQTIEIKYLPDKTGYEVAETPVAGYSIAKKESTGTLEIKKTSKASFTNTLLNKHNLTISKTVSGESGDKSKDWTFNIVLTPPEGVILADIYECSGTLSELTFTKNEGTYTANVSLKHNQHLTINGLPDGTVYKVTEQGANSDGYQTTILSSDATPNDGIADGTLTTDQSVDFDNRNPVGTGNLYITKEVKGKSGDIDKEFTFIVSLKDIDGTSVKGEYNYSGSKEGTIKDGGEIKLKNGERIDITNLPLGTQYEVNEVEANLNGYVTASKGERGKFDDVYEDKTAAFTNTRGTGALTISKSLNESGSIPPNMEQKFNFRITLDIPDDITDESVEYSYTDNSEVPKSGNITFTKDTDTGYYTADIELKFGQSITINDLIDGTKYSVTETDIPVGYTPDVKYTPAESVNWGGPINPAFEEFKADIVNTYNVKSAEYTPQINKTVIGDTPHNEVFTFNIVEGEDNPENGAEFSNKTATVTGSGNTNFGAITFTKAGTYKFKITEADGGLHGYTYDESVWTLTVEVADDDSQLEVVSHSYVKADGTRNEDGAAFTNTYKVNSVTYTPKAIKTLIGAIPSSEGTFNFSIKEKADNPENGAVLPEEATATVKGEGTARFGAITFTKAGEYKFEIREIKGDEAGYTYDESVWTLTVVVIDNNSQLEVESHSYTKADGTTSNDGAEFTNTYNVSPTEFTPKVNKTVKGDTPSDKTFTFNITANEDNPNGASLPTDTSATVTGSGTASFDNITFSKAGEYSFEIIETKGNDAGYTYDESVWTLTVVVVDNDSKLEVQSHSYAKADGTTSNDGAAFTNTYNVSPTEFTPKVNKTVKGDTPSDKTFTFNITESEDNPNGASLPTDTSATVTGSGSTNFGAITFTKTGTYKFEIKEEQGNEPGYSYDGSVWTLTVEVIDDNSQLKVSKAEYKKSGAQSSDEASFENNYSTTEVSYSPQVEKEITGDTTPSDKEFTFNIQASEDNPDGAEMPTDTTATVKGAGSASFGDITFTKAGTYTFKISETKGNDAGYTYDESVYTLKVIVEDVDSALTIKSRTYEKEDGESSEERALFTNTYSVEPTEYTPQVEKTVTGNTPSDETFTFNIKASEDNSDGAEMPTDISTTVTGSGTASFDKITFTKAGTYTFEISEEKGNAFGYTYDESVWTLTVVVVDNESKLEVQSHTYTKADGTANEDKAEFENIYSSGSLTISKVVTGNAGDKNKEFTFIVTLTDVNGNPLEGEYRYTGSKEGTIKSGGEIKLKDGESVTISGLPIGTKYTVDEAEANKDGYTTTSKGESGEITENEQKAEFTNSKNTEPTNPTTPTEPTDPTDPTKPTESKKTTTTKRTSSNPPYGKTKTPTSNNNNANGGNNGNTPNTGSESERNLPIAFLVTFLLGLNTVYFSFRRRKLKGKKAK